MTVTPRDELMERLAELPSPVPRAGREARVRARCHAALNGAGRPAPFARQAGWALDRVLPAAVVIYGVVVVVEGLRMAGLL